MSDVAILLATYNGEKYILELLESLDNQSYSKFVCYIHDDGSTDRTLSLCKKFCDEHSGKFVMLEYPVTGGAKRNFFSLMKRVEADFYLFCDQDDFWMPEKVEKMMIAVRRTEDKGKGLLVASDLKVVDKELNILSESFYRLTKVRTDKIDYKNSLVKGYIPGCSMLIDRKLRDKAIQYENIDNIKMHDWWITILAYLTDAEIAILKDTLVLYRQHSNNTIGAKNLSTIDRISYNLKRIASGELIAIKKQNLETPRVQARELYETGFGSQERRVFIREYYEIGTKSKMYRIYFYLHHFHHVNRLWWMLLWV